MRHPRIGIGIVTASLGVAASGQDTVEPTNVFLEADSSFEFLGHDDTGPIVDEQGRRIARVSPSMRPGAAKPGWSVVDPTNYPHNASFQDADLRVALESLATVTNRTLLVEEGVCGQITAEWESTSAADFYENFVSILQSLGFVVTEDDAGIRIMLDRNASRDGTHACRSYPDALWQAHDSPSLP